MTYENRLQQVKRDTALVEEWLKSFPRRRGRLGAIYGSARTSGGSTAYRAANALGMELANRGWTVATGGGPGIMEAVQSGVGECQSMAVRTDIPGEEIDSRLCPSQVITLETFMLRKLLLTEEMDAIWVFPGGVGTMDELFEVLVLQDTNRISNYPKVLVDPEDGGYWKCWRTFIFDHLIDKGFVDADIMDNIFFVNGVDDALNVIGN